MTQITRCCLLLISCMLVAADEPLVLGDCSTLPCADVLPGAVRFEAAAEGPWAIGFTQTGEIAGWVILSTDVTELKGYSGKPLETLVALNTEGLIAGARLVRHSEPILLVGIPEEDLLDFVAFYTGKPATARVVVGRAKDNETYRLDAISGATVTALAQNRTILDAALALGEAVDLIESKTRTPGSFVQHEQPMTWRQMERDDIFGRLTVSAADVGLPSGKQHFMDLWFTVADAPQVGLGLMAPGDYNWLMKKLQPDEHLLVVLGQGSGSFKGSGFVRGGLFDRIRLEQGLQSQFFRDTDYFNLSRLAAPDAPEFKEGAVFITRENKLDPGRSFDLVFLGSQYDGKGGFSRDFYEFSSRHRLPSSLYQLEGPDPEAHIWVGAWYNNAFQIIVCFVILGAVFLLFCFRGFLTGDMKRLKRLHLFFMVTSLVVFGVMMHLQPSVTQVLTFVGGLSGHWDWGLFLSEPLLFITWIFIAVVTILWGRGVFCGWICPYGVLTELISKLSESLGFRLREFPEKVHQRMKYLRYLILLGLIPAYLYSPQLGERLAEIEPFKSTFFVLPWTRHWGFFTWWLFLLGASAVMYRPFCRYLCPLGAALALPSSFRLSGPYRRDFCSHCKICTRGCEPLAIGPNGAIDPRECLSCMECEANWRDDDICPPLVKKKRDRNKKPQFQVMEV